MFDTATLNPTWWYLTLAQILLFVLPLVYLLYQKVGLLILPLAFIIPMITVQVDLFSFYLFAAALGMVSATTGIIETSKIHWIIAVGATLILLNASIAIKRSQFNPFLYMLTYAGIAFFLSIFAVRIKNKTFKNTLGFLGKHSSNIFLIHTFFFAYWLPQYLYRLHYAELIWLALMCISLLTSLLIQALVHITGYEALVKRIGEHLERKIIS